VRKSIDKGNVLPDLMSRGKSNGTSRIKRDR